MSTIQLNSKDFASQTSSAEPVIASGVTGGTGIRSILQVKTTQTGGTDSTTSTSLGTSAYEISDLTTTFTVASTSKVLITGMLHLGHVSSYTGRGYITYNHSGISETVIKNNINSYGCTVQFNHGADPGTTMQTPTPINLMLSPATANELTFKFRIMTSNASYISILNRDIGNSTDANDGGNTISSLTFWELATAISPTVTNVSDIDT